MSSRLRPAWLQSALTDIEQRVKALSPIFSPAAEELDSFATRAENYYQKRPQLISLLHDLHNRYLNLADRYTQSFRPCHRRLHSASDLSDLDSIASDDAESSLSFDRPPPPTLAIDVLGALVAELVAAEVDREILLADLGVSERVRAESARKAELQGSLLDVLEAERMVLLGENARLGYDLAAASDKARGLALEAAYTRQKAAELAHCVVKMRADHRVCLLGRKIEELQKQVHGLERRNKECYEAMAKREVEKIEVCLLGRKIEELQKQVHGLERRNKECYEAMAKREVEKIEVRMEVERLREENRRLGEAMKRRKKREAAARWWEWVTRLDWVISPCGRI